VRLTADQARDLFAKAQPARGSGLRLRLKPSDLPAEFFLDRGGIHGKGRNSSRRKAQNPGREPQVILTRALRKKLGCDAVLSEVLDLIPGRRFRADIAIPAARLVIEFDGFQYHRSKTAFQKDRERQNLFVAHGWRVLRFFNKQVRDDLEGIVAQIIQIAQQEI
jgi:hypothetical protein